ncbi:MAG: hypothetical protein ACJAS1_000857 [Oleiphilaceae bacterium]|jgi:hypothetical protein
MISVDGDYVSFEGRLVTFDSKQNEYPDEINPSHVKEWPMWSDYMVVFNNAVFEDDQGAQKNIPIAIRPEVSDGIRGAFFERTLFRAVIHDGIYYVFSVGREGEGSGQKMMSRERVDDLRSFYKKRIINFYLYRFVLVAVSLGLLITPFAFVLAPVSIGCFLFQQMYLKKLIKVHRDGISTLPKKGQPAE